MKDERFERAMELVSVLKKDLALLAGSGNEGVAREVLSRQLLLVDETGLQLDGLFGKDRLSGELATSYYKNLYPEFKSLQLYCLGRYGLLCDLPGSAKELRRHYQGELSGIERFFLRQHFHYGYYCLKASDLDALFFSGSGGGESLLLPVLPFDVPEGVPAVSYLFAMFMAYERLRADLLSLIAGLKGPCLSASGSAAMAKSGQQLSSVAVTGQGKLRRPFQWTGEVIHLIELGHGLHLKGSVNNGETGIMEFFEGLGEFFGVNLGVPKRGFEDLKARKRLSKTHFTDQLREALLAKMAESDSWPGGFGGSSRVLG